MIGKLLRAIAEKLGFGSGGNAPESEYDLGTIEQKARELESNINFRDILNANNPALYMTNSLGFTDDDIELFTNIVMHSTIDDETKTKVLDSAIDYFNANGKFSFLLHSFK